jgi:amidophosphoribosyltransferase
MSNNSLHEACGIFGVFNAAEASSLTFLGLYALQHRGQESSGIVSSDGSEVYIHKAMGLVNHVFRRQETLNGLKGNIAIGHNR